MRSQPGTLLSLLISIAMLSMTVLEQDVHFVKSQKATNASSDLQRARARKEESGLFAHLFLSLS